MNQDSKQEAPYMHEEEHLRGTKTQSGETPGDMGITGGNGIPSFPWARSNTGPEPTSSNVLPSPQVVT